MSIRRQIEQIFRIQPNHEREVDTQSPAHLINRRKFLQLLGSGVGVSLVSKLLGRRGELNPVKQEDLAEAERIRRETAETVMALQVLKEIEVFAMCPQLIISMQDELQSPKDKSRNLNAVRQPDGSYVVEEYSQEDLETAFHVSNKREIQQPTKRERYEPIAGNFEQLIDKLGTLFGAQPDRFSELRFSSRFSEQNVETTLGVNMSLENQAISDAIVRRELFEDLNLSITSENFICAISFDPTSIPPFSAKLPKVMLDVEAQVDGGAISDLVLIGPDLKEGKIVYQYLMHQGPRLIGNESISFDPDALDGHNREFAPHYQKLIHIHNGLLKICDELNATYKSLIEKNAS